MADLDLLQKQAIDFVKSRTAFADFDALLYNNERTLVIVVDMVKGFCTSGALASENCNGIASGIALLLKSVPRASYAFVRDCHDTDSIEFKAFPPHCVAGTCECELVDELKDFKGVDIKKNSTNAYFSLLKEVFDLFDKYDRFVLVGVCTDICVLQLALTLKTAINENNLKNEVSVISSLTQTFDLGEGHPSDFMNLVALRLMENSGVKVFK